MWYVWLTLKRHRVDLSETRLAGWRNSILHSLVSSNFFIHYFSQTIFCIYPFVALSTKDFFIALCLKFKISNTCVSEVFWMHSSLKIGTHKSISLDYDISIFCEQSHTWDFVWIAMNWRCAVALSFKEVDNLFFISNLLFFTFSCYLLRLFWELEVCITVHNLW